MSNATGPGSMLMVVMLSLPSEHATEFNDFYHGEFLPSVFEASDEIVGITRYEAGADSDTATSQFMGKRTVTVYEISSPEAAQAAFDVFGKDELKGVLAKFKEWKERFTDFSRQLYRRTDETTYEPIDAEPSAACGIKLTADRQELALTAPTSEAPSLFHPIFRVPD